MPTVFCRDCDKMTYYTFPKNADAAARIHRVKTNGHRPWVGNTRPRSIRTEEDEAEDEAGAEAVAQV